MSSNEIRYFLTNFIIHFDELTTFGIDRQWNAQKLCNNNNIRVVRHENLPV